MIYTITQVGKKVISLPNTFKKLGSKKSNTESFEFINSRCIGYFFDIAQAKKLVKLNAGDLNKVGAYPWVVIEEVREGFYSFGRKEHWYQYNLETGKYIKCKKQDLPEFLNPKTHNICNWGFG